VPGTVSQRLVDLEAERLATPVTTLDSVEERSFLDELADGVIGHDARLSTP